MYDFIKHKSKVIAVARRIELLNQIKDDISTKYPDSCIHIEVMDVSDSDSVRLAMSKLPNEFKQIDVLINNAGLAVGVDHLSDVSDDAIHRVFDTNVKGLLYVTKAVVSGMKQRNSGHIINVGSVAGKSSYAGGGVYCASKHAVHSITDTLRYELLDTGIRVTEISPGLVETEFSKVRFDVRWK